MPTARTLAPVEVDPHGASLPELKTMGTDLIGWYQSLEKGKTGVLHQLAEVVVEVRSQFWDEELNQPDWRGKTWDYRQFIGEMYAAAGIPPDSVTTIQGSLRYHVGNVLRERLQAEGKEKELLAAGMKKSTPKERHYEARKEAFEALRAMDAEKWTGSAKDRIIRWRQMVESADLLSRKIGAIDPELVPKREARAWAKELAETEAALASFRRALEARLGK
jgi:hypothetical protein